MNLNKALTRRVRHAHQSASTGARGAPYSVVGVWARHLLAALLLGLASTLALGHGGEDHSHEAPAALPADTSAPRRLADGSLFIPKPVQRQWGVRTQVARVEALPLSVEFTGLVVADPAASGRVQASVAGRVEAGPQGWPTLGQRVRQGQTLARLRPTLDAVARGNQQAQLAELEAQRALNERKRARYAQLEGAIPAREVEAAAIEHAALTRRLAALQGGLQTVEALTAPVAGVVSAAHVSAGQVVEARELLFEIVDPARLAVEALAYDPAQALGLREANLILPGASLPLTFVGAGRQLRGQALPLLFRVSQGQAALAVGQPVQVVARSQAAIKGVAVPLAAVQKRAGGESVVWLKQAPERFVQRTVQTRALDGERLAVVAGLAEDERVVTQGANLLSQVR